MVENGKWLEWWSHSSFHVNIHSIRSRSLSHIQQKLYNVTVAAVVAKANKRPIRRTRINKKLYRPVLLADDKKKKKEEKKAKEIPFCKRKWQEIKYIRFLTSPLPKHNDGMLIGPVHSMNWII